jgi:hypothetical protein
LIWAALRGHGVVVVLLAHRIGRHQHLVARHEGVLCDEVGLRLGKRRLGVIERGDVRRRIDLVQALTGLHDRAFGELAAQHDAVDPCAHLRNEEGVGAARQFADDRHTARLDRDDTHFGSLRRRRRLLLPARCEHYGSRREAD